MLRQRWECTVLFLALLKEAEGNPEENARHGGPGNIAGN